MRFLVSPGKETLERARPPVRWFLAFAALLVVAWAAQRAGAGGLTPAGVAAHYLGEPGVGEPLAAVALWEEVHVGAFLYGFLLLILSSLHAVSPIAPRLRSALLWSGAAAALADLFAPFAILALGGAGWLRVVTFVAASALLLASIAAAATRFGAPVPRA